MIRLIFRWGNKWLHRADESRSMRRFALGMLAFSWLVCETIYALSLWLAVGYGRYLEPEETTALLLDWLIGTAVTWFMIEPAQILTIAALPCIFKSDLCDKVQEWLSCCGLDLSFFF